MSIIDRWKVLDAQKRFLIAYPFWFIILFGVFYWGKFWDLSIIGKAIDSSLRTQIMDILKLFIDNKIVNSYEIVINPHYSLIITPECNGLIPYFIYLAGVLAYPSTIAQKLFWGVLGYIVFFVVNIIRLLVVTYVVNIYGYKSFFYIHDIGGNLLLIAVGLLMFKGFLFYAQKRD